ncbi:MAG: hypothetical protein FD130_2162, partial [Halothiobacillaceae bacterium]
FLILDKKLGSRQAGRLVQRLFEIEVYRMMALLALPVSKELLPWLSDSDRQLSKITAAVATSRQADTELLNEITQLAAAVENSISKSQYRLDAAHVHYKLVGLRIEELREQRIQGLQTFREFMERRLEPAMNTCQAVEQRQRNLSERIAHASQLLRTRVEITIEMQNQKLLASMNQRAKLQLRLQETVEGLSVVVITYYFASLVGYMAKAGKSLGLHVNPDLVMGVTIPLTAIAVAVGVRYIRRVVERKSDL